jgi:putative mRNA 3-end processing factor
VTADLVTSRPEGLYCPAGGFHIDPWGATEQALVTHPHGDHARPGSARYLCAAPAVPFLRRRLGPDVAIEGLDYGAPRRFGATTVSFHPAGHILGSAQIRLEAAGAVWVVSGDYKRAPDPTCAPFEVVPCDVFVTEATFALPIYRWEETASVVGEILAWWDANRAAGVASVLFCYAMGKAQRLLAELGRLTERRFLTHGAVEALVGLYRESGIVLPETASVVESSPRRRTSFAGELILAPPSAGGTPWMKRFGLHETAFASGFMRVRGARRRRSYDRGFVLSDHADWPALLRTIDETGARRVCVTHGHTEELARFLRERGLEAEALRTPYEGEAGAEA